MKKKKEKDKVNVLNLLSASIKLGLHEEITFLSFF